MSQPPGGLGELPAAVGPSDQVQEQINTAWNTYFETESRLVQANIHPLAVPLFTVPEVTPQILQGLNGAQYMEVYSALDAWTSFIGETVSQVQNIVLQLQNEMDDLELYIQEQLKSTAQQSGGKKPSAEELKSAVQVHPRFRWLKLELQKNKQYLNRLEARQKTLSRAERMLSRNIEMIKAMRESAGGVGGIGRRGSPDLPPRMG